MSNHGNRLGDLLKSVALAVAVPGLAAASPLPQQAYSNDAPVESLDKSGPYVGTTFGIGGGKGETEIPAANIATGTITTTTVSGGLVTGYQKLLGKYLVGVEADVAVNGNSGYAPNFLDRFTVENPWFATARARFGYSFGLMTPYLTGGVALGGIHSFDKSRNTGIFNDEMRTQTGLVVGAGIGASVTDKSDVHIEMLEFSYPNYDSMITNNSPSLAYRSQLNETLFRAAWVYRFTAKDHDAPANQSSSKGPTDGHLPVGTLSGIDVGAQLSQYDYSEHVLPNTTFVTQDGLKYGGGATATQAFRGRGFVSLDTRFGYGENDYKGSGTQNNLPDYLAEGRILGGKDFFFKGDGMQPVDFSPFVGIGFRYLYNDARGTTSIGSLGYRRYSHYLYIPLGVTNRIRVTDNSRISTTLEYDRLIFGWQESDLADTGIKGYQNVTNDQYSGYGLRGSVRYEYGRWSTGPYFNYWDISKSTSNVQTNEPRNQTLEYGVEARYRF